MTVLSAIVVSRKSYSPLCQIAATASSFGCRPAPPRRSCPSCSSASRRRGEHGGDVLARDLVLSLTLRGLPDDALGRVVGGASPADDRVVESRLLQRHVGVWGAWPASRRATAAGARCRHPRRPPSSPTITQPLHGPKSDCARRQSASRRPRSPRPALALSPASAPAANTRASAPSLHVGAEVGLVLHVAHLLGSAPSTSISAACSGSHSAPRARSPRSASIRSRRRAIFPCPPGDHHVHAGPSLGLRRALRGRAEPAWDS